MPNTFLHTCYRIGDIDCSVAFYEKLGFAEARRMPIGDEAINVFMALPDGDPILELTYNHGVTGYELGTGYNHIALAVADLDGTLADLAEPGSAGEAALPPRRPHHRQPHRLRPRPRRLPDRAGRARRPDRVGGAAPDRPRGRRVRGGAARDGVMGGPCRGRCAAFATDG